MTDTELDKLQAKVTRLAREELLLEELLRLYERINSLQDNIQNEKRMCEETNLVLFQGKWVEWK